MSNHKLKEILVNKLTTRYRKLGHGPPLLFLHGHRADTQKWLAFIKRFARDYTVYAPELPGQNQYTPPFSDGNPTMEHYADFAYQFCQKLKLKRITAAGVSMGGLISIWLSIKYPQLLKKQFLFWTPIDHQLYTYPRIKKSIPFLRQIAKGGILLKLWQVIIFSPLLNLFLRWDVQKEEQTKEVLANEIYLWRTVDLLTWSRSLLDILSVKFNPKLKIHTPTLAVFATNDRYLNSRKTQQRYQQIFTSLRTINVNSKFHVPKGNLTREFVQEYEEVFTSL
ncbi:hypothetical protein B5M47_02665 [candidate division CPR3 bacterium 4484_211]|uniref:AB hydrolase-1 domain-containing protein n=1 Tax=candidate division CPR3 bacterium 4484_211 TaxID=1968527 RepID=A0A1W9NXM0_UNCC3|nr:MAG: hypothetical protein B5M47_02665 [candidate division CPR3 bacterium 4484_211]